MNVMWKKPLIPWIMAILVLVMISIPASADEIIVQPGDSIQDAIDSANPGDTIIVEPGTYEENIVVYVTNLTILANDTVTIDAMGADIAVLINASEVVFDGFTVTNVSEFTTGIVAEDASEVQILNNIVDLDVPYGVGIVVDNVTDVVVDWNTVNITAEVWAEGIDVFDSENAQVTNNIVDINTTANTTAQIINGIGILAVNVKERPDRSLPDKLAAQDIGASAYYYAEAYGIYVESDNAVVYNNTVDFTVLCEGPDPANNSYYAYGIGIEVNGDKAEVTVNRVTGNAIATTYATPDGIYAEGYKILIESNTINLNNQAEVCYPCGIYVWFSDKAQVINNTVSIEASVESGRELDGYSSGQIWIQGIEVYDCYQSQIAENTVDLMGDITFSSIIGGLSVENSEKAQAMSEIHESIFGSYVDQWAGGSGISLGYSDGADVHENKINVAMSVMPQEAGDNASGYGDLWAAGLDMWYSDEPMVYENKIIVTTDANATFSAELNESTYADGYAWSNAYGIDSYMCYDAHIYNNDEIKVTSTQALDVSTLITASEVDENCLMARLAQHIESTMENVTAITESEGSELSVSSYGYAYGDVGTSATGIYAGGYGDVRITDNPIVEVLSETTAVVNASEEVSAEDAYAYTWGHTGAQGIIADSYYYYSDVEVSENNVSVDSAADITVMAQETVQSQYAYSQGYHYTHSNGILAFGGWVEVVDNPVVDVNAECMMKASALEGLENDEAQSYAGASSYAGGIGAYGYYEADVSGNDVNADSNVLIDVNVTGTSGDPYAYAYGNSFSEGIWAENAVIADNDVNAYASVDGATIKVKEMAAQEVGAEAQVYGEAFGIIAWDALVDQNTVYAEGSTSATLIAETEALLENAYGYVYGYGRGVGIYSGSADVTRNTVEGHADADVSAEVNGYRTDVWDFGYSEGTGIISGYYNTVQFNNIAGSDDYGLDAYWYYTDASYNWWGDASGPSGMGPGTGDAVYGTWNYEPWLTQPFETVLDEDKAYFGFELLPWMYYDSVATEDDSVSAENGWYYHALREGWNTMSTPIALEDDTWSSISSTGDGLDYEIAYGFDASTQSWEQIISSSELKPLDAIYIKMNSDDRVPLCVSPAIQNPAVKQLQKGWNLIGPAYNTDDLRYWQFKDVDEALISVEKTSDGLTGYTIVLSPALNEWSWTYTVNEDYPPTMDIGRGYWVYMENPDKLAGFSSTPLPIPFEDYYWYD